MTRLMMLLSCVAVMAVANLTARAAPTAEGAPLPDSLSIPTSAATTAGHPRQTTTTKVVQVGPFKLVASDPSLPYQIGMDRSGVLLDLPEDSLAPPPPATYRVPTGDVHAIGRRASTSSAFQLGGAADSNDSEVAAVVAPTAFDLPR